jgi:hypothetical protein
LDDAWDDPANSTVEELQHAVRAARRPKPPSLKEQALTQITQLVVELDRAGMRHQASILEGLIRRALEAIPK